MTRATWLGPVRFLVVVGAASLLAFAISGPTTARQQVPDPRIDAPLSRRAELQTAVLAGGCFWGVEAVFEHLKGVTAVSSGYVGGDATRANYEDVSAGSTGHAEAVRVTYDPAQVSYGQLLKVFFAVAHDPTQLNRQGPDRGTQYRSAIFTVGAEQARIASAYVAQLSAAKIYGKDPIVTQLAPLPRFHPAEAYHQDFALKNPSYPYIVVHDAPKVARLKKAFPHLYREQWASAARPARKAASASP